MTNLPTRKVKLELKIHADSEDEMSYALNQIATEWALGHMRTKSATGGCSTGWSTECTIDESMTPERYQEELKAYLAAERTDK